MNAVEKISRENLKEDAPEFAVGDTVRVEVLIREGEKERIQAFSGTVIPRYAHMCALTLGRFSSTALLNTS